MNIESIKNKLPSYASDLKLNLSSLANETCMNPQQLWGSFLVSAMACGNCSLIEAIKNEAGDNLSNEAMEAAKSAFAIMSMNNIYFRFVHLVSEKQYGSMQAKLRMNVMANPGVDKGDFELWTFAVSVINGCGMCMDSHEKQLAGHGFSKEQIQTVARIASVIHGVASVLDIEQNCCCSEEQQAA